MTHDDFITAVATRAEVPRERATAITYATLETLADRISAGEAADVAGKLPDRLADRVRKSPSRENAEPFGLGDFVRRVSRRAGVDESMAQAGAHAVMTTLGEAVPVYEFKDVLAQLSKDYWAVTRTETARRGVR